MTSEQGDPAVTTNIHECFVCGRGMPHCSSSIRGHLNVHDLSIDLYYEQHKEDIDRDVIVLPITDKTLLGKANNRKSLSKTNSTVADPEAQKVLNNWLNRCTYTCRVCNEFEAHNYYTFLNHTSSAHKLTAKAYIEQVGGKLCTAVVEHTCQLCGLILHWDRAPIISHLSNLHASVTIQDYVQTCENGYSDYPTLPENENEKWMNQCVFMCKECKTPEEFNTRNKLILHLGKEHKLAVADYSKKHGSLHSKFSFYSCKVCEKSVRWDSDSIIAHLDKVHSMSHETYAKDYLKDDLETILNKKKKKLNTSQNTDLNDSTNWLNKCSYSCKMCEFECSVYTTFFNHITKTHHTSGKEYMKKYGGELMTTKVYHTCQLCGFVLPWDRYLVVKHVSLKHNSVSLLDYSNKFESIYQEVPDFEEKDSEQWMNRCIFECKECEAPKHFNTRGKVSLHLFKEHQMVVKDYIEKHKTVLKTVDNYTCKVCNSHIRWDSENIIAHLDRFHQLTTERYISEILNDDLETHLASFKKQSPQVPDPSEENSSSNLNVSGLSNWLNRCHYACTLCSFEINNYSSFFGHLKAVHKMSGKEYLEQNGGKLCSTAVSHTCQICGFILDWDRTNISKHFQTKHNSISLKDYFTKYADTYTDFPDLVENEADKWMNQSTFQCKVCDQPKDFNTRNKLMLHLLKEHNLSMKSYLEKEKQIISSLVNHTCKLCDKVMRWDSDTLIAHFDRFHSITPQNYFDNFLKDDFKTILASMKKSRSKKSVESPNTYAKGSPTIKWNDKCSFSCQICFTVVKSKNILKWHLHNEHKMNEIYYTDHFSKEALVKVTHGCLICGEEILFDSLIMSKHLAGSHDKMTVAVYKSDFFNKYTTSNLNTKDIENDWIYKSHYNCKICLNIIRGKDQFKKHLTTEHSTNFNDYAETHGHGIFEEHFHTCLVEDRQRKLCSKKVLWDGRSMTYHLGKHNLNPEEYHSRYVVDNNEKIVETEKEDWTNKCTFLCKICSKIFDIKSNLISHLKEDHDEAFSEGNSVMDFVVDYMLHTCQVCSDNILWEDQALKSHLKSKHSLKIEEYASKHLRTYQENEDCKKEMDTFDSWINQCIYRCMLCPDEVVMDRKMRLLTHLSKKHSHNRAGYFVNNEETTFVEKIEHVCQICTQPILWDVYYLQKHIENIHKIKTNIYRAKFMSKYTDNAGEIEKLRKEENRIAKASKKTRVSLVTLEDEDSSMSTTLPNYDDEEDDDSNEEVRTWARGCLYCCEICDTDFVGARAFQFHLESSHQTSYKRKNGSNQSCVISGFHFCRLCCNNVRHDEADLKSHFSKEHKMTVSEYYQQFKGKLRMPRLERPSATRTSVNTNDINNVPTVNKVSSIKTVSNVDAINNNDGNPEKLKENKKRKKGEESVKATSKKRKST